MSINDVDRIEGIFDSRLSSRLCIRSLTQYESSTPTNHCECDGPTYNTVY